MLLGGGLRSPSAFLVHDASSVLHPTWFGVSSGLPLPQIPDQLTEVLSIV